MTVSVFFIQILTKNHAILTKKLKVKLQTFCQIFWIKS